jgi:colanic acid biosynthesis glycosyl transferase WcaI
LGVVQKQAANLEARMNSPKLVFINRYFYPDHSATSQILTDLAFALAERGHYEVHVVTSRQRYDDAAAHLPKVEKIRSVTVHRVWTSRFGRRNLWGRSLDYASFYGSAARVLYGLADSRSILIAKTDPPLISLVAAGVARLRNAGLINWIQDLFPEVAEALGLKVAKGPACRFLKRIRNHSLKAASANVVIGDSMKERLLREGVSRTRIRVIHNWADEAGIRPVDPESNPLRKEWGLEGKFVVGYSGNLGRGHEFETLLDAAGTLRERADLVFLIIGGGAHLQPVRAAVAARGLNNFVFQPYQPRERLSESLSAADAHLVSLRPELEGCIVPSKFYGIAAAGRPVLFIGSGQGEIARIVAAAGCGYPVAAGGHRDLRARILELAENPERCRAMGAAGRRLLESRYGREVAFSAWQAVLAECARGLGATGDAAAATATVPELALAKLREEA